MSIVLPASMAVLERGWLSANNILLHEDSTAVLIDSGYVGHVEQTLSLIERALAGRTLRWLVNTHCHSDHMGGNHAIQSRHGCRTSIPVGEAALIDRWDPTELILDYADQRADRFRYDDTFAAGDVLRMGNIDWQVIGAPGHDMHAVMFFDAASRVLISGDALWQNGFGVVFGALRGSAGDFQAAAETLDHIERLAPLIVIPGHGAVFDEVSDAIARSRSRLASYSSSLDKLARHCVKALFTYAMLDKQRLPQSEVSQYLARVPVYGDLNRRFIGMTVTSFAAWLITDLVRVRAIALEGDGDDAAWVPLTRA